MKKHSTFSLIVVTLLSSTLQAQESKTSFGIQAGVTYANMTLAADDISLSGDYKPGITAGVFMDQKLGKMFYLQTGLNFTQKGSVDKSDYGETTTTLNYLEIPLNFLFRSKNQKGFFIGGGPSLGCGLAGTEKSDDEKYDVNFGGEGKMDRFELAANFLTGYKFANRLQIAGSYNFGITSLADEKEIRYKNNYFALRIGYSFK